MAAAGSVSANGLQVWASDLEPSLQRHWDHWRGVRFGEASHPGPGGSAASRRRRKEKAIAQGLNFAGFGDAFKPLIEKLMRQIMQKVTAEIQKMLGSLGGSLLVDGAKGAHPPPERQRPKKKQKISDKTASNAAGGQGGGGKNGAGKSGLDGGVVQNTGANTVPLQKVQQPQSQKNGKGQGHGAKANASGESDWVTVVNKKTAINDEKWVLRAGDWDAPIMTQAGAISGVGQSTAECFSAVVLCSSDEAEVLGAALRGSGKVFAVTAVHVGGGEQSQKIPGAVNDKMAFKWVTYTKFASPDRVCPELKVKPKKVEVQQTSESVVLFVKGFQRYVPKDTWSAILHNPRRFFYEWLSKRKLCALDSWQWIEEKDQQKVWSKVFGKVRISNQHLMDFLQYSGDVWFFEPPRSVLQTPLSVKWIEQDADENALDYLKRVKQGKGEYGLIGGHRQLGLRVPRTASEVVSRTWILEGAPRNWTSQQVMDAAGAALQNVVLLKQFFRGGGVDFLLRGASSSEADAIPLEIKADGVHDGGVLWLRWAPPRKHAHEIRKFSHSGPGASSWQLQPLKEKFQVETVAVEVPNKELSQESKSDTEAKQPNNDKGASKSTPPAKRAKAEVRALPAGVKKVDIAKDGDCLFSAACHVIQAASKGKRSPDAATLRAEVCTHFKKNMKIYEKEWDHELPDKSACHDFAVYISSMEKAATWGGVLEQKAIGRLYGIRLIIFTLRVHELPFHVHKAGKMVGGLLFDGAHYDVLEPVDKALPQSLLDIKNGPPEVPMRGGGSKSSLRCTEWTSSAESRRTEWSQPSQAGTPAMASLRSSSSGRRSRATAICGRAKAEEPVARATASTVGGAESRHTEWTKPSLAHSVVSASLRSSSSGRRPRATATSGRAEAAGCAKGIVASSGAQPSELDVDEVVDSTAPASALSEWYKRGSKQHPSYVGPQEFREECAYCAKVFVTKTAQQLASKRWAHHKYYHDGLKRVHGRFVVSSIALRKLRAKESFDWKCPLCCFGIPKGERAKGSRKAFELTREKHRLTAHPKCDKVEFAKKARKAGAQTAASSQRCRVHQLNSGASKRVKKNRNLDKKGFIAFTWPKVEFRRGASRLALNTSWKCAKCSKCFLDHPAAVGHHCGKPPKRAVVRQRCKRLQADQKKASKLQHGMEASLVAQIFASALQMLGSAGGEDEKP